MPHDDSSWRPDSDPPSHIRAARAQVEAARLRQRTLAVAERPSTDSALPDKSLPGYTLLREIHRGGQGVVYLAVQHSTDRQVAIKLFNCGPFLGSSVAALARFEREVEALTLLKHPNIVTIHDCGRDDDHVFMVMDFVNGRPLDAHVGRDGETPIRDILALFAKVCDGVNAAHLRGVIHRDVKPANILVDERGEPHVLDFGLAKLVNNSSLSAAPTRAMTETGQFVGSLPWASPEQAEGRSDELDIRTDVYSLGVVLYQLLTGRFPYPVAGRLVDVVRQIVHTDPVRPSAIDPEIDRELETILLKCLAKEPDRRYQSAGELARDLRRYLAREPIEARRDSLTYLMTKRLARYRAAAIAAAAILLILSSALIVSLSLWRRAERQRAIAQTNATAAQNSAERADSEAQQARAAFDFMREVLTSVRPENRGADVRLIQVLTSASATASQRFAAHPEQEAQVRELLGDVYNTLAMWNESKAELGRARVLFRTLAGPDDPRTLSVDSKYLQQLINIAQTGEAEQLLTDLVPRLQRVFGPDDPRSLIAQRSVAVTHLFRGRADQAGQMLQELRAHPRMAGDAEQVPILCALVAVHKHGLSTDDLDQRRVVLVQAEAVAREWIERSTRLLGPHAIQTLQGQAEWADLACSLGHYQAAADACRAIVDHSSERLGLCHHIRVNAMYTLAEALTRLGDYDQPAELHLARIPCLRERLAPDNPLFLGNLSDAVRYIERGGRLAEGEAIARELAAAFAKFGGHGDMAYSFELYVAHFASMQNRLDEADALFPPLLAREDHAPDRYTAARLHLFYACHLTRRGLYDQAEQHLHSAVSIRGDILRGTWDTHPDDIIRGYIALYQAWGKPDKVQEYQRLMPVANATNEQRAN